MKLLSNPDDVLSVNLTNKDYQDKMKDNKKRSDRYNNHRRNYEKD